MKRQRVTLSSTSKEILSGLQYRGYVKPDWFICNREHRAMDTLCRHNLAIWYPDLGSYRITAKGYKVKGWSFYK